MAAIWKGSVSFGLVNIPVELRTAVRADHISFRLLHKQDLSPVKYERVCLAEDEPVDNGVLDLMSRLKASLEQGSGKKAVRSKRSATTTKSRTTKAAKRKTA